MSDPTPRVQLYTDGACKGNPGPGGWGFVLVSGTNRLESCGGEIRTTNNRMELMAAIRGLEALTASCSVEIWTDSRYVQQGITQWIHNWRRKGWKTASGGEVKNVDLWQELDAQDARHKVEWKWVKGHAGHSENERCDRLAVHGAERAARGELEDLEGRPAIDLPAASRESKPPAGEVARAGRNIEIKLAAVDHDGLRRKALAMGAKDLGELEQSDRFFPSLDGTRLKLRRERVAGRERAELIGYRRGDEAELRPSGWELVPVEDPRAMENLLGDALGRGVLVEKRRQLLVLGALRIHLDRVTGLGEFVELERVLQADEQEAGVRREVERLMSLLGLDGARPLEKAYAELLAERA